MKLLLAVFKIISSGLVLAANKYDGGPGPSTPQSHTLDVSSDEKYLLVTSERKVFDNVDYEQSKPKPGVIITKIVDGELEIWENHNNVFKSGAIVHDGGRAILMNIEEHEGIGLKHYRRTEGRWEYISESDYNKALKELRDSVPISSSFALNLRFTMENSKYLIEKFSKKFVNLYVYTPTMGHRAKVVYDHGKVLWRAQEPSQRCVTVISYLKGEIPLLAHLFVASDDSRVANIYYKREGNEWVEVSEEQYPIDVLSLRYDTAEFTPINLDMNRFDYKRFEVKPSTFEFPYLKYMPKQPYRITSVSHGNHIIWESQDPQVFHATSVDYYDQGGLPMIKLNLNYKYPNFYSVFIRTEDGWEEGDEFDIDDRTISLQCDRYRVLDLAYIEKDAVNILPLKMENVDYMLISPRLGSEIMIIKDDDQVIWNYSGLENYFSNGWLYFYPELPKLFHFRVRDPFLGHEDLYYINQRGVWEQISKEDYVHALNDIVYSSKHGIVFPESDSTSDDPMKSLEKQKLPDSSSDEEPTKRTEVEPGFKESLYSKYGSPDYDMNYDEEVIEPVPSPDDEHSSIPSKSFEYITQGKSQMPGREPFFSDPELRRRKRRLRFDHYEPREFREPKHRHRKSNTPVSPPYASMDELGTLSEQEVDELNESRSKKFKSTDDIVNEINDEIYQQLSDGSGSQALIFIESPDSARLEQPREPFVQPQEPEKPKEEPKSKSDFTIPALSAAFVMSLISLMI